MGLGMAAMALPASAVVAQPWTQGVFATLFGASALHGLLLARADARHLHHTLGSLAMVYMALAMSWGSPADRGGHHFAHPTAGGVPLLTGALLAYYALYVLRAGSRLASEADRPDAVPTARAPGLADARCAPWPEVLSVCRLSMGIGMFAMLLTL